MRPCPVLVVALLLPFQFLAASATASPPSARIPPAGPAAACPDADLDGYAECTVPGCASAGLVCGDCNDADPGIHPGAIEVCNHRDDDCNLVVDDGFALLTSRHIAVDRHPHANDRFGTSVASIGDVDGDHVPDFVVGAAADDLGGIESGTVTLYSGADRAILCRAIGSANDNLGISLAAAGDIDFDGTADILAAAPNHDAIIVLSGADCSQIAKCVDTAANVGGLGADDGLAGFVDLTGDGIPEILAGADDSSTVLHYGGRAVVFTVTASGTCSVLRTLTDPELAIYAYLGFAITGIADVTGDGTADIAVGEPGYSSYRGAVLVFSGADGALVRRILDPGGAANNHFGESLATLPCLDGDGIREIAAASPRRTSVAGSTAGHVLVISPEDGTVIRDIVHADGGAGEWLGSALATLPDLDGDGVDDIVAGARYADPGGHADAGLAVVFSARTGAEILHLADPDGAAGDQFGYAVASAGDLSGDGLPEILVAAPYRDGSVGVDEGRVMLVAREPDCDGDGLAPFAGDCNDADIALWAVPAEARNLALSPDRQTLSWDVPTDSGGTGVPLFYDVLRATAGGQFKTGTCLATGVAATTALDPALPAPGGVSCYLVRAQNGCGDGSLGTNSAGDARRGTGCP